MSDAGFPATRRLFFALWPAAQIRAALVDACRPALSACNGRAVSSGLYHMTLAFLGELPAERLKRLDALDSVSPSAFELLLDRFGHWPGPRVLWIGSRECSAGLVILVAQIRAKLDVLGIGHDGRDFKPHVTLARKVTTLPELDAPIPVRWPVCEFVLVESVTTADGPVYEVVRKFPLSA